jgi:hypothetical protein
LDLRRIDTGRSPATVSDTALSTQLKFPDVAFYFYSSGCLFSPAALAFGRGDIRDRLNIENEALLSFKSTKNFISELNYSSEEYNIPPAVVSIALTRFPWGFNSILSLFSLGIDPLTIWNGKTVPQHLLSGFISSEQTRRLLTIDAYSSSPAAVSAAWRHPWDYPPLLQILLTEHDRSEVVPFILGDAKLAPLYVEPFLAWKPTSPTMPTVFATFVRRIPDLVKSCRNLEHLFERIVASIGSDAPGNIAYLAGISQMITRHVPSRTTIPPEIMESIRRVVSKHAPAFARSPHAWAQILERSSDASIQFFSPWISCAEFHPFEIVIHSRFLALGPQHVAELIKCSSEDVPLNANQRELAIMSKRLFYALKQAFTHTAQLQATLRFFLKLGLPAPPLVRIFLNLTTCF